MSPPQLSKLALWCIPKVLHFGLNPASLLVVCYRLCCF